METLSYEKRIELGNLVPALGQFKVMEKIPQYQQCEVHNLVEAPAEVPETLRHVVFNIERGQTLHETIDFLNMCPDLKNMDIIYANELDDGAVRSGNCNVAYEIAKSIGMNYAYGLEFIELVNPDDNKGFHGNALFSRWPIRWAKVVHMPEQYNWYNDRQKRIGGRCAILAKLDVHGREVGVASIHLENRTDGEGRRVQMQAVLDEGYITNVAVRPDCRKQGVAGKLLQVFLDFAQANHLAFLTLEVRASNYPAIALYGSRGFRGVGRRKNYYEHPREDAIIMTREFEQHGTENPVS